MFRFHQMAFETFNKSKDYEEIKAYFEGKDTTAYDLGLSQALEQILGNVHWITVCNVRVYASIQRVERTSL
jgi:hypothetical protein